jgi:hypothetical protein
MPSLGDAGPANVISGSTMFGPVAQTGVVIQRTLPAVALPPRSRPAISESSPGASATAVPR